MLGCKSRSPLACAIKAHRDFHFKTGLILDMGVRTLGLHKFPFTSPLYKLTKVAGYAHVSLASIALVIVED